jgi:hypothetical protein
MKKADKEKQTTTSVEKADNESVYSQPAVQQKTEQGEAATYDREPGHEYENRNTLPQKENGDAVTTGVDEK